ncbi:MAG: nucleotidyltransferase domain-containing protein [Actinomycetota bacterium]|jgi:predicted nucleotidyltransferase|nr:nucleotidyltransferase domain-containing protein [Actinomycetota bacterium]
MIAKARAYVAALGDVLDLVGAGVIGSVARGDFNVWSDIDVLVIAEGLPSRYLDRATLLATAPVPRVQAVAFTPEELVLALAKRDPRVVELQRDGVLLVGAREVQALLDVERRP